MKALFFTLLFTLISSANTPVKVDRSTPLHTYNHKPSIKLKKHREFRALAKVKKQKAFDIALSVCNEPVRSYKLTHNRQLLFYRMYTQNCKLEINALDGSIISKVLL